jgi:hypothetical protein
MEVDNRDWLFTGLSTFQYSDWMPINDKIRNCKKRFGVDDVDVDVVSLITDRKGGMKF